MLPTTAIAQQDIRAQRQYRLDLLLGSGYRLDQIVDVRNACALGRWPAAVQRERSAGLQSPDASDVCVAALTRLGREGGLGFIRDTASDRAQPALAFDSGFVAGYRKAAPLDGRVPSMASLHPLAERCLAQIEPDTELCYAAGYAYGTRAANGETVTAL